MYDTKFIMNFFKNLKKKFKKFLFCFDSDSVAVVETYPTVKYNPIFTIGDDDSDYSDIELDY